MAQLVEQRIRNAQAVGSSPTTSSRKTRKARRLAGFLLFRSLSAGLDLSFISSEAHAAQPCAINRDRNPLPNTVIGPGRQPAARGLFRRICPGGPRPGRARPAAGMISQYRKMSKKGLTNAESGIIITIPHELNIHINFY